MAFAAAVVLIAMESVYGYMTVPHEYGHLWAAKLVGHKVSVFQVCIQTDRQPVLGWSRVPPPGRPCSPTGSIVR
jgi:membrane-associated protease RseP (regulator of RpoE activity)